MASENEKAPSASTTDDEALSGSSTTATDKAKACTLKDLQDILQENTKKAVEQSSRKHLQRPNGGQPSVWLVTRDFVPVFAEDSYNEVYPGIVLGDKKCSTNIPELKSIGITHVLNTSQGKKFAQVDTDQEYYAESEIQFMGIPGIDIAGFKMSGHFQTSSEFIGSALEGGGKVFVHCNQGISRSATVVLAYLMLKQTMTAADALKLVLTKRCIRPNDGFLKQLCQLQHDL